MAKIISCHDDDGILVPGCLLNYIHHTALEPIWGLFSGGVSLRRGVLITHIEKPYRTKNGDLLYFQAHIYCWMQPALDGTGFMVPYPELILRIVRRSKHTWNMILKLPARSQRARSNGRTTRSWVIYPFMRILKVFSMTRISLGPDLGMQAKKKKIQSKLQARRVVKTATKKGPVKRSKDTKKSVWA